MDKIVTGCKDCPACRSCDMTGGYECKLSIKDEFGQYELIEESEYADPITPSWCPLRTESITIKMKDHG